MTKDLYTYYIPSQNFVHMFVTFHQNIIFASVAFFTVCGKKQKGPVYQLTLRYIYLNIMSRNRWL